MRITEGRHGGLRTEPTRVRIPITAQERFVRAVYSAVDEATATGLDRLRSEDGIVSTCRLGCCHCCRFHILLNVAEAHTLAQYVRRELSAEETNDLRIRTRQWHEWDDSRPGRYPSTGIVHRADLSAYDHCCPLLVNGACRVYPVRPFVCRTHFVCSDSRSCHAANDPETTEETPVVLASLVTATRPFSTALRNHIENAGLDFSRSVMLLPHWLAIQMGWAFAISP